jgi:hypothetical protein
MFFLDEVIPLVLPTAFFGARSASRSCTAVICSHAIEQGIGRVPEERRKVS